MSEEITLLSAAALAAAVASGEFSATEVCRAYLERIEERNPQLNAIVRLDAEGALAAAARVDAARAAGGPLGPLAGVPLTIKSSIDVAGLACECGSRMMAGRIAPSDAPVVARLRRAGAAILGVTNTPDMLLAYETDNHLYGRSNHPLNAEVTPGGSSGGEAAAIAAGLSAGGLGSDGGGSVRVPAHFCGLFGLKPTPGVIARSGHFPACAGPGGWLGLIGPMARTGEDLQLLLEASTGPDPGDPFSTPIQVAPPRPGELEALRIGWFVDDGVTPATAETRAAVETAAAALERQGLDVRPLAWDFMQGAVECWWTLFGVAARTLVEPTIRGREDDVHPLSWGLMAGKDEAAAMSYPRFLQAWVDRDRYAVKLAERMEEFGLLLAPVAAVPAFEHGRREWMIDGRSVGYPEVFSYSQVFNLTGNPAAVVPVGRTADGMPIGVQVVGRRFEDARTVALARSIESALAG